MSEPTAQQRARQMNSGAGVASRLNPVQGYRDALARAGKKVVNHAAINRNAIRSKQEQKQQEKEQELEQAMQEKFKMQRFKNVEGRALKQTLQLTSQPAKKLNRTSSAPRLDSKHTTHDIESDIEQELSDYDDSSPIMSAEPSPQPQRIHQSRDAGGGGGGGGSDESIFNMNSSPVTCHPTTLGIKSVSRSPLTEAQTGSNIGTSISKPSSSKSIPRKMNLRTASAPKLRKAPVADSTPEPRPVKIKTKGPVPRADEQIHMAPHSPVNHVVANTRAAVHGTNAGAARASKHKAEKKQSAVEKEDYGKVPQYLLDRKIEMAQEAERKREASKKSDVPPGMVLMSEEERVKTVAVLQTNLGRVMSDLASFPLTVETESRKRRKLELENKVKEIEHALTLFNRKKVYITA